MGLVGRNFALLAGGAAVCALCASAGPAMAQDTGAAGQPTLLQRLILGFGRPKVATDTPTAVTVIEQDDIDEEIPDTASELAEKIPGVNATGNSSNMLGQNFSIRGFGPESVGSSQEGRVQINVDGATKYYESYRMGGFMSDMELYKRVEVLRGPAAGTLYGSGVLGGVINFTTKDASDFLEDDQTLTLRLKMVGDSNQEGYKGSAILATRLGDNAEFLLSGNYTDFKETVTGEGRELPGTDLEAPSFLAKGTYYFDEAHERTLRMSYNQTTYDGVTNEAPGGAPFVDPYIPGALVNRQTSDQTATIKYTDVASDNPWLDLDVTLSYTKQEMTDDGFLNATVGYSYYEFKTENTSEWVGGTWENYLTVGVQAKYHERRRLDPTPGSNHPEYDQRGAGIYAQDEFIWDDRMTIISGMRMDWSELSPAASLPSQQADYVDTSGVAYAPKIAVLYDLTDSFSVFGSLAYTERLPSGDEEFDYFGSDDSQNVLEKERAKSIEIGFGQDLNDIFTANDALAYKVTSFYNHVDDLIVRNASNDYENIQTANLWGVELEGSYEADRMFASVAASLIRGENADTGEALANVAPDEVAFTLGGKVPDHNLRFGWNARFVAGQDRVPSGTDTAGLRFQAFNVHDIFATWKPQEGFMAGFEVTGRVDNLFDTNYQEYLQPAAPAKGRTFKISLAKTFGM